MQHVAHTILIKILKLSFFIHQDQAFKFTFHFIYSEWGLHYMDALFCFQYPNHKQIYL